MLNLVFMVGVFIVALVLVGVGVRQAASQKTNAIHQWNMRPIQIAQSNDKHVSQWLWCLALAILMVFILCFMFV